MAQDFISFGFIIHIRVAPVIAPYNKDPRIKVIRTIISYLCPIAVIKTLIAQANVLASTQ